MVTHGVVLGHIVSQNGLSTDEEKVKVILTLPPPIDTKFDQRFMEHVNYYRRFVIDYAHITCPLHKIINQFEWADKCQNAFETLKKVLPILRPPKWGVEFCVHTDASKYSIGSVLTQRGEFMVSIVSIPSLVHIQAGISPT